jgi:hypothetical protein
MSRYANRVDEVLGFKAPKWVDEIVMRRKIDRRSGDLTEIEHVLSDEAWKVHTMLLHVTESSALSARALGYTVIEADLARHRAAAQEHEVRLPRVLRAHERPEDGAMNQSDAQRFRQLLAGVYSFYRQELSDFQSDVWWQALRSFEYDVAKDAFNRHLLNPDNGQFLPKPADIVKLTGGGTADRALVAWTKFDQAVKHVGSWDSVVFDDAIIHQVADDMGGWSALCGGRRRSGRSPRTNSCSDIAAMR